MLKELRPLLSSLISINREGRKVIEQLSDEKPQPAPENKGSPVVATPPAPEVATVPALPSEQFWKRLLFVWLLWRLCALGPWIWLASAVLHKAFGWDVLPCPGLVFFAPILTLITAQISRQQLPAHWPYATSFILNPLGVVAYVVLGAPLVWLYVIFWKWPRNLTSFAVVTHPVASLALLVLVASVWLGLLLSDDALVLQLLIYCEIVLVVAFLAGCIRWASDPLKPCLAVLSVIDVLLFKTALTANLPGTDPNNVRWKSNRLTYLGWANWAAITLSDKFRRLAQIGIVSLFLMVLLGTFFFVATAFGGIIFAAQRLAPPAFSGLDANPLTCWAYSVTALTTSPIGTILPQTGLGYFIYTSEVICTFLLLSVLFSLFALAIGISGPQRTEDLEKKSKDLLERIAKERELTEAM